MHNTSKKILFVSTIHRMSERVLSAIIDYHSRHGESVILNLGQSSKNTAYDSNLRYLNSLDSLGQSIVVYNGKAIKDKRDVRSISYCRESIAMISEVCKRHSIDVIVLDDSRASQLNLALGRFCNENHIKLYANVHGNTELHEVDEAFCLSKPFYHKLFVFGEYEVEKYNKLYHTGRYIAGGIPENDVIEFANKTEKKISVIVNRVVVDGPTTERLFDASVFKDMHLQELQNFYNLPIVFKVKDRMSEDTKRDVTSLQNSIPAGIDYTIETHLENEIDFLAESKIVLTHGSTMAFKALQLKIPTIIFRETGPVGLFETHKCTVSLGENFLSLLDSSVQESIKFLPNILEGSLTFNATQKYSDALAKELS